MNHSEQFTKKESKAEYETQGQMTSNVYHSSWKWYEMLKFLIIIHNATRSFDTMRIKLTKVQENESPAITLTKKTKEDFDQKRMSVVDSADWILKVNEAPTTAA